MEKITRKWFSAVLLLILSVSCVVPLMGQDQGSTRGNLGGTVIDKTGGVVAGANVTITGPIGGLSKPTDDQGDFLFSTLIPGFYSVKVEKAGFKTANVTSAEVLI